MMRAAVPTGLDATDLHALEQRAVQAHAGFEALDVKDVLGFRQFEAQATERARIADWAESARSNLDDVVILGIGGSALGAVALRTALLGRDWNARSRDARAGRARLHVLDNVDPRSVRELFDHLDLTHARVLVVSKSGSTAETMAQYLFVRDALRAKNLPLREHLAFVTDPTKGALRAIADAEGIPCFSVPPNVGGRFSVLTPVGTLPAALLAMDVDGLIEGARAMRDRCVGGALKKNPALAYAALQWRADTAHGQRAHVLMPYSDAFRDLAPWFVQLWAESLGKKASDGSHRGPTPIAAVGATDQHAQVQLFMEGPVDKTVTFIDVESHDDVRIPESADTPASLAYLKGRGFGELLRTECRATAGALARVGRPTMTLRVERADAWHLGGLFVFFELATIYAAQFYGVDPLDQPGVELGKQLTYFQFGHPEWKQMKAVWDALPLSDPSWVL